MKRILVGVCALAAGFVMATAAPTPAKAGGFGSSFGGAALGGFVGSAVGNALTQPRYRYGYVPPPPPPVVVYPQQPIYAGPGWCGATQDSYGNYCNVYACAKACNGGQSGFKSFRLSDCSYNPGGGYGRLRCTY
jgi:hypothetical protein